MAADNTITSILHAAARWLVDVSEWFDGWDTTLLVAAILILGMLAGVAARAANGPGLLRHVLYIGLTVLLALLELAVVWTLAARCLPIDTIGELIQRAASRQPVLVR